MKLVWLVIPGVFFNGKGWRWQLGYRPSTAMASRSMAECKSYTPGFRLVTLESAREDYGIAVPAIPAAGADR